MRSRPQGAISSRAIVPSAAASARARRRPDRVACAAPIELRMVVTARKGERDEAVFGAPNHPLLTSRASSSTAPDQRPGRVQNRYSGGKRLISIARGAVTPGRLRRNGIFYSELLQPCEANVSHGTQTQHVVMYGRDRSSIWMAGGCREHFSCGTNGDRKRGDTRSRCPEFAIVGPVAIAG